MFANKQPTKTKVKLFIYSLRATNSTMETRTLLYLVVYYAFFLELMSKICIWNIPCKPNTKINLSCILKNRTTKQPIFLSFTLSSLHENTRENSIGILNKLDVAQQIGGACLRYQEGTNTDCHFGITWNSSILNTYCNVLLACFACKPQYNQGLIKNASWNETRVHKNV